MAARHPDGRVRLGLPWIKSFREMNPAELAEIWSGDLILLARRVGGPGIDPRTFGFRWFFTSIWRYRRALVHVLLASLFIQCFALITPLFFQIVIDKVLVHKAMSTLVVVAIELIAVGLFNVILQYLRTYALSHTTSRIDVELGSRLFNHLLRLPLAYFETRPTGQTVARVRELETIRAFSHRPGSDLLYRSAVYLRLHRGALRLLHPAHHDRALFNSNLYRHRAGYPADAS